MFTVKKKSNREKKRGEANRLPVRWHKSTYALHFFCFVLFCFVLFCFVLFCFVLFCVSAVKGVGRGWKEFRKNLKIKKIKKKKWGIQNRIFGSVLVIAGVPHPSDQFTICWWKWQGFTSKSKMAFCTWSWLDKWRRRRMNRRETPNRGISCAMIGYTQKGDMTEEKRRGKKKKKAFWNFRLSAVLPSHPSSRHNGSLTRNLGHSLKKKKTKKKERTNRVLSWLVWPICLLEKKKAKKKNNPRKIHWLILVVIRWVGPQEKKQQK